MQLVSSLLFGISASLDALLAGVSFGLRGIHVRLPQNIFISLIALLGTCLSVGCGGLLTPLFPPVISRFAGSLILTIWGICYIAGWFPKVLRDHRSRNSTDPEPAALISAEHPPESLAATQILLLSLTLSANNLGIGLSASIAGLTLIPAVIATFICSVLFLYLGNRLGRSKLMKLIGRLSDPISGILLASLGLIQLLV